MGIRHSTLPEPSHQPVPRKKVETRNALAGGLHDAVRFSD